jgi:hypothetical protein
VDGMKGVEKEKDGNLFIKHQTLMISLIMMIDKIVYAHAILLIEDVVNFNNYRPQLIYFLFLFN